MKWTDKTLQIICIAFTYVIPFVIIAVQHLYNRQEGFNLTLIGWFLVMLIGFIYFRLVGKKVHVWDVKNENRMFVYNFYKIKTMLLVIATWFIFKALHGYYDEINATLLLILVSLVIGWVCGLILEIKKGVT